MKAKHIVILALIAIVASSYKAVDKVNTASVNPIIGDASFINAYGYAPSVNTDENVRIQTHLEYVEGLLRKRDVSKLSYTMKQKRKKILDLLHSYISAGQFPKNYDHKDQRKPCFIDKDGSICAVGYLVEKTAGRIVAEKINSKHKYETINDMAKDHDVSAWIANSGLTTEECAMIQPAYGYDPIYPYPSHDRISPAYGVSSALLGGMNLSFCAINSIQVVKGRESKAIPIIGFYTGAISVVIGSVVYFESHDAWSHNNYKENISLINIGLGASTMILSSWNLIVDRKPKPRSLSWNLYSYPVSASKNGIGFSLTKRI